MKMENGKLKMRKTQTSQTLAQRAQLLFLITLPRHTDYPMDNEKIK